MSTKTSKYKKSLKIAYYLLPVVSAFATLLPFMVNSIIRKQLKKIKDYDISVAVLSLSFFKRTITIKNIRVENKLHEGFAFLAIDEVIIKFNYKSLKQGTPELSIVINNPEGAYIKAMESELKKAASPSKGSPVNELVKYPFVIEKFEINNASIRYVDRHTTPQVEVAVNNLGVYIENVTSVKSEELLPTAVIVTANAYGGSLLLKAQVNVLEPSPTFDANMELKNIQLKQLNAFFKAYANIDISAGVLSLFAEVAAKEGRFNGYVKPVIQDLDIVGTEDKHDNFWNRIWEGLLSVATKLIENPSEDEIATKIPVRGTFKKPSINVAYAITSVLTNAFIHALKPQIDNEISLRSGIKR